MPEIFIISFNDRYRKDHGALAAQVEATYGTGKTLCGRLLNGGYWFNRGNDEFKGNENFYCEQCCRVYRRLKSEDKPSS